MILRHFFRLINLAAANATPPLYHSCVSLCYQPLHDVIRAHVVTERSGSLWKSHVHWDGKCCCCVAIGVWELIYWLVNSMVNLFMLECGIIMWHADYIYVPKQYNYAGSKYHRYCNDTHYLNYVLLCASHHRTVAQCCAVNSDSGTAQL